MTREAVESIEDAVKGIIIAELRVERSQLGPTTHLMKDLGADSLDALNIALRLEERFRIKIPDDAIPRFLTIGLVVPREGALRAFKAAFIRWVNDHADERPSSRDRMQRAGWNERLAEALEQRADHLGQVESRRAPGRLRPAGDRHGRQAATQPGQVRRGGQRRPVAVRNKGLRQAQLGKGG